ncbi:MAG: Vacuolar protein sorting-associated protein 41 [Claussenomyces sp. TS43310]|nr:MAG: Vacuolar protein sorting-associated protein 41 [Claussenomyces sp. TS43310]
MAADSEDIVEASHAGKEWTDSRDNGATEEVGDTDSEEEQEEEEEEEEDDEEEDEPKLKYARMTSHLLPVYRNGDATSAFLVAGDKMFIGTHNGNIHVVSLPSFHSLRVYHAHSASITAISISPYPPPSSIARPEAVNRVVSQAQAAPKKSPTVASGSSSSPRTPRQPAVPNTPSNAIYIATASLDGNVCVASLVDAKDVQLRNFARPIQAVALSPDYRNDRTYLSGGLAGELVVTVGGRAGTSSTSTTVGTASATASSWLGSIGLSSNTGKDTVLHSGEGAVSTIKWSLSGKYVAWVNEHGIKIMRSNLHLESADSEFAWKRIGHVPRPHEGDWDDMAGVWKARVEWIDEKSLETDEDDKARELAAPSPATAKLKQQASTIDQRIEKLVVGWGGTVWMINIHPGGVGVGKHAGERTVGQAEIIKILRMDCIVSGLSLYTPTLLLVLAYILPDEKESSELEQRKGHKSKSSISSTKSEPSGGIRRRQNALSPELRLIDLASSEEVDTDGLTVSRFERLSATDYHLGILPAQRARPITRTPKGTLEALTGMGTGLWNATVSATTLLSSSASVRSNGSRSDADSSAKIPHRGVTRSHAAHPHIAAPGMKIFIHSPYDCIIATKRDLSDHLSWLVEQSRYELAWNLIDDHPEVISSSPEKLAEIGPGTTDRKRDSIDDFYDDNASTIDSASRLINSSVEKEKRRIGELWIQQLVATGDWVTAGKICGKVLGTSSRWEHWVWTFASAKKFDEISDFIPTTQLHPPLASAIYEVVLGHYIQNDRPRARDLLDQWPPELFDIKNVTIELENQLKYRDVREDSVEGGERGRDWRIVQESLGKLYTADGRPREALKCFIRLQDADAAMALIKDYHLVDAVADDIPGLILLRVTKDQARSAPRKELEDATSEAINLLVVEAQHGIVRPEVVVNQLQDEDLALYLFFYLKSLWKGEGLSEEVGQNRERLVVESKSLVDEFADLTIRSFASYDRPLLMEFLKTSTSYTLEKASQVCEARGYIPELVYLYSKTGQTKRALFLIIDRLADVSQAIAFAKQQDDSDLWEDLLNYSMDKPRFIRGLLEEVGTAIDPITLVRRIPEGLEIPGLREGLSRMVREYDIQHSISSGVARVLRGEVAIAQITLRAGQRKGVKFDIIHREDHIDVAPSDLTTDTQSATPASPPAAAQKEPQPGHCVSCQEPFNEEEKETLVGFACGHIFHLPHLLSYLHPSRPPTPPRVETNENGDYARTRSIGAKVTHARLLRDKISGGCPVCAT